jgi:protein tyrosine/serine phosphatase
MPAQARPPSRDRKRFWARLLPGLLILAFASLQLWETISENFRVIVPQCAYRSGQLGAESLDSHIVHFHLQSIINLRGANPGDEWYQDECAVAARDGVAHYDMPTDSSYPPTADDLRHWIDVLDHCPKPLLIHCQSGIDRTGLLAAVCTLRLDAGGSLVRAREQLGWSYGHLPWRANRSRFLAFLDLYEQWLTRQGFGHSPERFGYWATRVYASLPEWTNPWETAP